MQKITVAPFRSNSKFPHLIIQKQHHVHLHSKKCLTLSPLAPGIVWRMSNKAKRTPRPATAEEAEKDWEDEYRKLHAKHLTLKQLCNDQEEHIKLLHVKTRKIENAFAALERKQYGGGGKSRIEEDQAQIASLEEKVQALTKKNTDLSKKNKLLADTVDKKKKQISSLERQVKDLKRQASYKEPKGIPPPRSKLSNADEVDIVAAPSKTLRSSTPKKGTMLSKANENLENDNTNSNVIEIAKSYKKRLDAAEEQLRVAREENDRLRGGEIRNQPFQDNILRNGDPSLELRDAKWKLQQLQTQYDHIVAKSDSQKEALKCSEEQAEESAHKVRELRRVLEDLRHEKEITDIKAARVNDLEEAVIELRQTNRGLEDKISRLCEAPFISDAFGQHEAKVEFEKVMMERQDYVAKVDHLQEAVRTQYSALVALKQQAAQLREEKEEAEKTADDLRSKYSELEAGANILQDKLRLYSGEDGVNIEALERALTVVKRRSETVGKLDFIEDVDGFEDIQMPALKKKAQEIQVMNLNLTKEVERLENMLKLQSNINRDLHKELESIIRKRDKDKREAAEKSSDFEELAMRRLNKIHSLEAQIRELVYGVAKKKGIDKHKLKASVDDTKNLPKSIADAIEDMAATSETGTDNALLAELLDERNGDINPDENLLEVWIKGAKIRDGIVMPGSSTFVVVDFFDYESQTTSLLSGSHPKWDFGATFKISVDDFLIRHLATDTISFELNMASQGDFTMLACCTAPLSALLRAKPLLKLTNHPMISPRTGEIIAHVDVEIRLALPLSELYRLFLERHPDERRAIEEKSAQHVLANANIIEKAKLKENLEVSHQEDESRMYNELEVAIFNIKGLPKSGDVLPSPYVHFQFLGYPDKFTDPVANTCDPSFDRRFNFPMITNEQQCRLLRRSQLHLKVIDIKGEEDDDNDNEGLIGEANISLTALSEGSGVNDSFSIKDASGKRVGTLRMSIRWVHKFRPQRELGPRALSGIEVESLISSFCPGLNQEGVVNYYSFLRFVNPPEGASRGMEKLHSYLQTIYERDGIAPAEILKSISESVERIDRDHFINCFSRLEVDVLPDEWGDLFKFIDSEDNNSVSVDQILAILNLDEVAGISPSLQEKLTLQVRNIVSRGIDPIDFFSEVDNWGQAGQVTRMEFKLVLKKMGFQLVDELDEGDHGGTLTAKDDLSQKKVGLYEAHEDENDVLNDTFESDDVLLPAGHMDGNIGDEIRRQKEIFQRKLDEIQHRSAAAVNTAQRCDADDVDDTETDDQRAYEQFLHEKNSAKPKESNSYVGKNILENDSINAPRELDQRRKDQFTQEDEDKYAMQEGHRSSVAASGGVVQYDGDVYHRSATKIQSRYRGNASRKKRISRSPDTKSSHRRSSPSPSGSPSALALPDIIQAEQVLRKMINDLQGVQHMPNFHASFATVDTKNTGYVSRKQFAHAMNQFENFKLPHAALRTFMNFFDSSDNGMKIDYNAFVRFCRYRPLNILPAVSNLQRIVFLPSTIATVRKFDTNGTGYLGRNDMLKVLADLGYGHFSQSQALAMLALFETRVEGQVNYGNFIEYVRDNELSRKADSVCNELRTLISNKGGLSENNLKRWFKQFDKEGAGTINLESFVEFLAEYDLQQERIVMAAVFRSMTENDGSLITFPAFYSWAVKKAENYSAMYPTMTLAELQRKANLYLMEVAEQKREAIEEVPQAYLIYDWKKPQKGSVRRSEFIRATQHAGFVLTHSELRALCGEFKSASNPHQVLYKKFLSWASPPREGKHASVLPDKSVAASLTGIASQSSHVRTAAMIKTIEKSIERGTDLLSVFGRYDTNHIGRITADEFCAGLSDLGLSSVSQKDAFDLADRYKAAVGGFILYRRVFTEMLGQLDDRKGVEDVDIVEALILAMRASNVTLEKLSDVFAYYDRKNSGRIREEDLGTIFEEARIRISRQELEAVADKFAASSTGWLQYSHLLRAIQSRIGRGDVSRGSAVSNLTGIPDQLAEKVSGLLESLIIRGKDFRSEMDGFDSNFTGSIPATDFRDVFQERFRSGLSVNELTKLEKHYRDKSDARKVDFVRLIQDLHPRNFGKSTSESLLLMQVAETLRQKVRRRCDYLTPGELKRPFRHFARRKASLGFTVEELSTGLKDLGMRVSSEVEVSLFNSMNLDGGRAVRYNHFVVFVSDPHHEDLTWKFKRAMARARVSESEIMEALEQFDSNSSGLITSKQFSKALKNCNIDMSDSDISRFMLRFDNDEAQRFDIELFGKFLTGKLEFTDEDTKTSRSLNRSILDADDVRESRSRRSTQEAIENRVFRGIRRRILERLEIGFTESEIFALFDAGEGVVSLSSLQRGARELGLNISRTESRCLLRNLSSESGGIVDKRSFMRAMDAKSRSRSRDGEDRDDRRSRSRDRDSRYSRHSSRSRERGDRGGRRDRSRSNDKDRKSPPVSVMRLVDEMKRDMAADDKNGYRSLSTALEYQDVDRDGLLRRRQFCKALEFINCSLSSRDMSKIFEHLDSTGHGDGFVSIKSILRLFGGDERKRDSRDEQAPGHLRTRRESRDMDRDRDRPGTDSRSGQAEIVFRKQPYLLTAILEAVRSHNLRLNEDFNRACRKADRRSNGLLDKLDFSNCLRMLRLRSETERDLSDSLAVGGMIDYKDFLRAVEESRRSEEDMNDIFRELKQKISGQVRGGHELTEIFDRMDADGSGKVSLDEFKDGLRKLGIMINREETERILDKFSLHGGSIRFRDFIRVCAPMTTSRRQEEAMFVESLITRIQEKLKDRFGSESLSARRARHAFETIDVNKDGLLSARELKNGMSSLKVDLTTDDADKIINHLDPKGNGKLDYKQFVDIIGGVRPIRRPEVSHEALSPRLDNARVGDIVRRIQRKLEDSFGPGAKTGRKLKEAFEDADLDNSNNIDKREFRKAMSHLGVDLSAGDVDDIYDRYDHRRDGRLDYGEFIELLGFSSSSKTARGGRDSLSRGGRDSPVRSPRLDNARVGDIVRRIQRKLEDSFGPGAKTGRKLKEAFEDADLDNSNNIDKREFRKAMSHLGVDLSAGDVDDIYDRYDHRRDGRLDYGEFIELLGFSSSSKTARGGRDSLSRGGRDSPVRSPRLDNARVGDIVRRIQRKLEDSFGPGAKTGRKLKEAFEDADLDNSNNIDKREFRKAMSHLGVDLSAGDVDDIYDRYDHRRDGRLDYGEFIELLGFSSSSKTARGGRDSLSRGGRDSPVRSPRLDNARVGDIVRRIQRKLEDSFGPGAKTGRKLKEAFEDADLDKSNNIDKREFRKAMSHLGVDLSAGDVDDIYDRYDHRRDGRLDYGEFIELLGFSSSSKSTGSSARK